MLLRKRYREYSDNSIWPAKNRRGFLHSKKDHREDAETQKRSKNQYLIYNSSCLCALAVKKKKRDYLFTTILLWIVPLLLLKIMMYTPFGMGLRSMMRSVVPGTSTPSVSEILIPRLLYTEMVYFSLAGEVMEAMNLPSFGTG